MRKYIIAGNQDQYRKWIHDNQKNPSEYIYVSCVQTLFGLQNVSGYFIGTWNERKDIYDIIMYIKAIRSRDGQKNDIYPLNSNSYNVLTNNWT